MHNIKSTRERILQTLLSHPNSTINDLAESVGINAISVRHHLNTLQAEGLAGAEEERHGVGRPRLVYSLTEKGLERFPTRYFQLTNRLLDQIKETMPENVVRSLFTQMAENLTSSYSQKISQMNTEERLTLIQEILAKEGFLMEWEKQGNQYQIHEIACPYYHIGQNHPEVCFVDQTVMSTVLATTPKKISCVLHGDAHCTYTFQDVNVVEAA
jgi:DeoR family transcriptional regulator, suf operon transcriptional repressor